MNLSESSHHLHFKGVVKHFHRTNNWIKFLWVAHASPPYPLRLLLTSFCFQSNPLLSVRSLFFSHSRQSLLHIYVILLFSPAYLITTFSYSYRKCDCSSLLPSSTHHLMLWGLTAETISASHFLRIPFVMGCCLGEVMRCSGGPRLNNITGNNRQWPYWVVQVCWTWAGKRQSFVTSDSYAVQLMEADIFLYFIPQMQANWKKHDREFLEKVN